MDAAPSCRREEAGEPAANFFNISTPRALRSTVRVAAAVLLLAALTTSASAGQDSPRALWTAAGTGFTRALGLADIDGDGADDVVTGGRGVGAITAQSLAAGRYAWVNKWPRGAEPAGASDNHFAEAVEMADVTGDGTLDVLVGGGRGLHALDGRTGATIWTRDEPSLQGFSNVWEMAAGDLNGDGVADAVYAPFLHDEVRAVDGGDGSVLWRHPVVGITSQFAVADLNGDGTQDVLWVGDDLVSGLEIRALTGVRTAAVGLAVPLWAADMAGGDPTAAVVGQVVAGGSPEVVVGGYRGEMVVLDALTGATLASWEGAGQVNSVELVDLDGDADLEIVTAVGYEDDGGHDAAVQAWDAGGNGLWSFDARAPVEDLDVVDVDADGRPELVAGGGWVTFGGREELDGFVVALSPAGAVVWEQRFPAAVGVVAAAVPFGQPSIVVGHSREGGLRALDLAGQERWWFHTGGQTSAVAAADLDGDGAEEVLVGDDDATVAVRDGGGDLLAWFRVPGQGAPDVVSVTAGQLAGGSAPEVVVGTFEYERGGPGGRVHVFTQAGQRLWTRDAPGAFGTVLVDDLEGDGAREVIAGSGGSGLAGSGAQVARYRADGAEVWTAPVPASLGLLVEVAELNGDGVDDIVVGTTPVFSKPYLLGLDGATGQQLWRYEFGRLLHWIDAGRQGIVAGDVAGDVRLFDRAGAVVWTAAAGEGRTRAGGWGADVDGDGVEDVLATSESRTVQMLRGDDGEVIWRSDVDTHGFPSVAAILRGQEPAVVVGTSSNTNGRRSELAFFDAATGDPLGEIGTEHHVEAVTGADLDGDGRSEAVAGAGWQVHAATR